jgi:hypothetical protein
MATWWEERAERVSAAVAMIRAQTDCTHAEALASLRRRAEATGSDVDGAAAAVIEMGVRLGYRDLGPSAAPSVPDAESADSGRDASHLAGLEVVDGFDDLLLGIHHERSV